MLVREKPVTPPVTLGAFNLLSPANNSRITVDQGSASQFNIGWNKSANATQYRWFATGLSGSFNAPVIRMFSNNAGADTILTLTSGNVDAILASMNIKKGDSVMLKWTVFSYKNGGLDSLKASQDFTITIIRNRKLQAFSLSSPADNSRIVVDAGGSQDVVITWGTSASGVSYKWFLDANAGNFNNPWATMASDNSGSDTKITLTQTTIDNLLAGKSVADGDSVNLKWTVRAYEPNDSIQATQSFNVKFVRAKAVGLNELLLSNLVKVYPNPAKDEVNISIPVSNKQVEITLFDMSGKKVAAITENSSKLIKLNIADFNKGIYLLNLQIEGETVLQKLIIE